jgi:hypothetical protein
VNRSSDLLYRSSLGDKEKARFSLSGCLADKKTSSTLNMNPLSSIASSLQRSPKTNGNPSQDPTQHPFKGSNIFLQPVPIEDNISIPKSSINGRADSMFVQENDGDITPS